MGEHMRGIVFSGGGSRGQFHVGVAKHLIFEKNIKYGMVGGVSVGALVAGVLAQHPLNDEIRAWEHLNKIFTPIKSSDVYTDWVPLGMVHGLLGETSFLNSSPLENLVKAGLNVNKLRSSGKKLRVAAVNTRTGEYRVFTEADQEIANAVVASAAMPAFFKPVTMYGDQWIDGGIREVTPIKAAIDAGCTAVDVVICQPKLNQMPLVGSAMDLVGRSVGIMCDELVWRDVKIAQLYNELALAGKPGIKYVDLRVFAPKTELNADALNFDPIEAGKLQKEGYEVAREVHAKTMGVKP